MSTTDDFVVVAVAVIFNDKNQILLAQREQPDYPFGHKKWNFPGGGINFTEDPRDAAIRETMEEVGVMISLTTTHPLVYSWVSTDQKEQVLILAYPARYISGEIDVSADDGTSDARWFNVEDINIDKCLPLTKTIISETMRVITLLDKQADTKLQ